METYIVINIIIPSIVALLLFGAFNGVVIKWHNAHGSYKPLDNADDEKMRQVYIKRWSKLWHRIGLALRFFLWLVVWFVSERWLTILAVMLFTAIEYNISINLINGLKWNYLGTTAATDILIRKILTFLHLQSWLKS